MSVCVKDRILLTVCFLFTSYTPKFRGCRVHKRLRKRLYSGIFPNSLHVYFIVNTFWSLYQLSKENRSLYLLSISFTVPVHFFSISSF